MAKNLNKAFEIENGVIVDGVVMSDSLFEATRSLKPTFTNDLLTAIEYYNSLTQVDANRIAKIDLTYTDEVLTTQTNTYYDTDGTTVFQTESVSYTYSSDDLTKVEVS
jgi:hypothetical protein